jgi:rRNA maturation protein Rpf1
MTIEFMVNPENKEKVEALSIYSDLHKDAYGVRGNNTNLQHLSLEEINAKIEELVIVVNEVVE